MDIDCLKKMLSYDAETGLFTWLISVGRVKAGSSAGSIQLSGYVGISCGGKKYLAHRLAWAFLHGQFPSSDIDHANRVKTDNRLSNLRLASRSQNMVNTGLRSTNTSGVRGVFWSSRSKSWIARVQRGGKQVHIGSFGKIEDAKEAVTKAYVDEFGCFAA